MFSSVSLCSAVIDILRFDMLEWASRDVENGIVSGGQFKDLISVAVLIPNFH